MDQESKWSIGFCKCTRGMIHFTYGNATLHISADDVGALGTALEQMAEALAADAIARGEKQGSFH